MSETQDDLTLSLANLSLVDLKSLLSILPREIDRREKTEREKLRAEFEAMAKERGFALSDLVTGQTAAAPQKKREVPVKYRHPENPDLAWTGRGRKPKWVESWLSNGGPLEALDVNPVTPAE